MSEELINTMTDLQHIADGYVPPELDMGEAQLIIDTIEQLQQENQKLKQKNNILTEFEHWLEEEAKRKNSRWEQFHNQINTQELVLERLNAQIVFIECCLKRIQELKEGKK